MTTDYNQPRFDYLFMDAHQALRIQPNDRVRLAHSTRELNDPIINGTVIDRDLKDHRADRPRVRVLFEEGYGSKNDHDQLRSNGIWLSPKSLTVVDRCYRPSFRKDGFEELLKSLILVIRAVHRNDPTMPSVTMSQLTTGQWYCSICRYTGSFGNGKTVCYSSKQPTLRAALEDCARYALDRWAPPAEHLFKQLQDSLRK